MPRFHPHNPTVYLAGSFVVSLNKNPIFPKDYPDSAASGRSFLNDSTILTTVYSQQGQGQWADGNVHLVTLDMDGNVVDHLLKNPGVDLDFAGGNRWMCRTYIPQVDVWVVLDGVRVNGIAPIGISSDGWVAYSTLPSTKGLCLCPPGKMPDPINDQIESDDVLISDVQLFPYGGAVYIANGQIKQYEIQGWPSLVKTTQKSFGGLRSFWWQDKWWLIYQEFGGLGRTVVHPADDCTRGYVPVRDGKDCYRPDIAVQSDNSIWLVYSNRAEVERPGDIVDNIRYNIDSPMEELVSTPAPVDGEPMIPAFERPMWQAPFFSHHSRYGDTAIEKHVGNSIWIPSEEVERVRSLNYPLIVAPDSHIPDWVYNTLIAYWITGTNTDELNNKIDVIMRDLPEKPIIAYLDGRNWPETNPFPENKVWPSIQAYRFPGETLGSFKSLMNDVILRVSRYDLPMCLTSRFDDFNGSSSVESILECMPLYEEWLRSYYFVAHMPFSDRRGNAISQNESLWKWARTFQYAIPSGRPNRFDYWKPKNSSIEEVLNNKLNQTRAAIVLEPYLRDDILSKYEGENGNGSVEPDINEPLLKEIVQKTWDKYGGAPGGGNPLRGVILNEAAFNYNREVGAEHVGLSRKEEGTHVTQPHTDEPIAHDIIQVKPPEGEVFSTMYDVFTDSGVTIGVAEQHNNPDRYWVASVNP